MTNVDEEDSGYLKQGRVNIGNDKVKYWGVDDVSQEYNISVNILIDIFHFSSDMIWLLMSCLDVLWMQCPMLVDNVQCTWHMLL